jgi:hypothetical protein
MPGAGIFSSQNLGHVLHGLLKLAPIHGLGFGVLKDPLLSRTDQLTLLPVGAPARFPGSTTQVAELIATSAEFASRELGQGRS